MANKHTDPSPSKMGRRLACPGSYWKEKGLPDVPGPEAQEGSAAHYGGEICLRQGHNIEQYRGRKIIELPTGYSMLQEGSTRKDGWEVNREMVDAVQVYLDHCRTRWGHPGVQVFIEHRFTIAPGVEGSADHVAAVPHAEIYVDDLKYGIGVEVDPVWNPQGLCYGLGALKSSPHPHTHVVIGIIQPRLLWGEKIKTWPISVPDLLKWEAEVLLPGLQACQDPKAPLHAGNHCRFCLAKASCPEANKGGMLAIANLAAVSLADMTPAQLSKILDVAKPVRDLLALAEEEARTRIDGGEGVPGWKLVEGRGSRSWTSEAVAEKALVSALGDSAFNRKLKTPAQAEKALKDAGFSPADVAGLIENKKGGLALVKEEDKRRAAPTSAQLAFEATPVADASFDIG